MSSYHRRQRENIITTIDHESEPMNWPNSDFTYENMVRISVIGDGSCFFHALVKAFYTPYIKGYVDGKHLNKTKFIKSFRRDLSNLLGSKVDISDPDSPTHYDTLSRGMLREFGEGVHRFTLENMVNELNSDKFAGHEHLEFLSNVLSKDIYILDRVNQDVYIVGNDDDLYYKDRDSIVLLYQPGHYELVGLYNKNSIKTLFTHDSDFIKYIRDRMYIKRSNI